MIVVADAFSASPGASPSGPGAPPDCLILLEGEAAAVEAKLFSGLDEDVFDDLQQHELF